MRFVLRQGTREVLVFSRNRLAWFEDEYSAGRFLADKLQGSQDNLARLRTALADAPGLAHLATADAMKLVTKVAELLAQGELALLLDPDALAPWSWPFALTASVTQYQAGAEGEGEP
ncbi:MAG: hypothetical protein KC613_23640, partial [Myxococcales bacterium]|nr:hypothetical protein [Myxococcales bacterium]